MRQRFCQEPCREGRMLLAPLWSSYKRHLPAFLPAGVAAMPLPCGTLRDHGVSTEALLTTQGLPWSKSEGSLFDEVCQKGRFWLYLKGSDEFDVAVGTQQSQRLMKLKDYIQYLMHSHRSLTCFIKAVFISPFHHNYWGNSGEKRIRIQ